MLYPCDSCGKLTLAEGTCPYCGHQRQDEAEAIVTWLLSMSDAERPAAIAAEPRWPHSLVRTYPASTHEEAMADAHREVAVLAEAGYEVVGQNWVQPERWVPDPGLFFLAPIKQPRRGELVVRYQRQP